MIKDAFSIDSSAAKPLAIAMFSSVANSLADSSFVDLGFLAHFYSILSVYVSIMFQGF